MGHLRSDSDAFGGLKLTESSRGVLKGETRVMLREDRPGKTGRKRDRARAAQAGGTVAGASASSSLLASLRSWRSATAREHGVPAYVILHDATLEGIVFARPKSKDQLRSVSGIGDKKLEHYGNALLELVRADAESS
jgi:ATP-dependent DNA helicase RecQ